LGDRPLLQVAIDLTDVREAMSLAKLARDGGADIIEVGTPLIKCAGANVIRSVKDSCEGVLVLADLKTLDAGWLETEIAARNGADIVSISALAHNKTIIDSVMCGRNLGIRIMADLMQVPDPVDRGLELSDLGIDYLCLHTGIDVQESDRQALERTLKLVKGVMKNSPTPVAVAGGINNTNVRDVVRSGVGIVIVGSQITKSSNAYEATKKIRSLIDSV
jgi:3-hexulose-6-phosphate synthase/6-phospho-3-hexuloisomerase